MPRPKIVRDGLKQNMFLPVRSIATLILLTQKGRFRSLSSCVDDMILAQAHKIRLEDAISLEAELIKNRRSPYAKKDQPNRP